MSTILNEETIETIPVDDAPEYLLVHVPKHDRPCIQVMRQPYKGVTVKIGALNFKQHNDGFKMTFEFNVIDPGNHKERKLKKDKVLTQILGDIITSLMAEQIDELEAAVAQDGIGPNNLEKFDTQ